jgi:CubicO group peptidase (beta-lactamase class C family)
MLDRLLRTHGRSIRRPGGRARYSNIGFLAASEIIARTTGRAFEDYVTSELLNPLGMTATGFDRPLHDAATGYLNVPRPVVPLMKALLPPGLAGDRHDGVQSLRPFHVDGAGYGGLIGSATDAARFLRLHLGDGEVDGVRILTPTSTRKMQDLVSRGRSFDHATGWFRARDPRSAAGFHWEHYGTGAGYWNIARIYPTLDLGIVIMTNSTRKFDFNSIIASIVKGHRA